MQLQSNQKNPLLSPFLSSFQILGWPKRQIKLQHRNKENNMKLCTIWSLKRMKDAWSLYTAHLFIWGTWITIFLFFFICPKPVRTWTNINNRVALYRTQSHAASMSSDPCSMLSNYGLVRQRFRTSGEASEVGATDDAARSAMIVAWML